MQNDVTFLSSLKEERILTMRIRLRSRKKYTVVVTPVKPKELSTGSTYIYKDIHVSIAHLAFWSAHTISEDGFSIKPVYKLPAEQNAHPNQLMQEGLEMQRSNHLCNIRTASGAGSTAWIWAVGPWWCSTKSWTTAKVDVVCGWMFTAAWTYSGFRSVGYHRFIISDEGFKPCATIIWSHLCVSVLIMIQSELAKAAWSGIEYGTIIQSVCARWLQVFLMHFLLQQETDEGLKDLIDDSSNLGIRPCSTRHWQLLVLSDSVWWAALMKDVAVLSN